MRLGPVPVRGAVGGLCAGDGANAAVSRDPKGGRRARAMHVPTAALRGWPPHHLRVSEGARCLSQGFPDGCATGHCRAGQVSADNQHSPNTPNNGLRERGNNTSKSTGRSGRQKAATRRNMRREERVTVQGPVKEQQPDGMSHRGGMRWGGWAEAQGGGGLLCQKMWGNKLRGGGGPAPNRRRRVSSASVPEPLQSVDGEVDAAGAKSGGDEDLAVPLLRGGGGGPSLRDTRSSFLLVRNGGENPD